MGLKAAIYGCLFLCLVTLGLQLASTLTNGWLIIEGPRFADDNPWWSIREPATTENPYGENNNHQKNNSGTSGRIEAGLWYLTFCLSGKCEKIYDYRTTPGRNVRYFEGLPDELQACSVLGITFVVAAILAFRPLLKTYTTEPTNCWGIFISILMLFTGALSITLAFLAMDLFGGIETLFDHGGYEEIRTEVPYSLILVGAGAATSLVSALIMSIIDCKLHHALVLANLKERQATAEAQHQEEEIRKHHIPDRKNYNANHKKQPIDIKNKDQVVYSIHL
ncbi:hypothetical protein FSP39_009944 [Pinctada imbricata]|uniref:Uncharacterized protein n=1 Tax=Pinctada imbricata TaxID=66713 RepID=A0AA88Y8T1_PINIB|nr:hypothetical protein FSP39_009944 [Pinctada imbricata]